MTSSHERKREDIILINEIENDKCQENKNKTKKAKRGRDAGKSPLVESEPTLAVQINRTALQQLSIRLAGIGLGRSRAL